MLILLEKPQTIAYILRKSLFPHQEMVDEIRGLLRDAFVVVAPEDVRPAGDKPAGSAPAPNLELAPDISMSEAKFLLVDFCVDRFGTAAQALVDEIRACAGEKDFAGCVRKAAAHVDRDCPGEKRALVDLVRTINATA